MPSLGVLIGLPIAGLVIIGALIAIWAGWKFHKTVEWDALEPAGPLFFGGLATLVITLVITGLTMWPWEPEYHEWQTVSGRITNISSRIMGDGSTVNQRFVVQFSENGTQYSCDDSRCSLLTIGDQLTLSCKREWQFSGTPGWSCNFISSKDHS